jgi:protein SCO1/2
MIGATTTGGPACECGEFSLVDHFNRAVTEQVLRDEYTLVLFGFTHCRVVCPRALARHAGVLEQLASEGWLIRGVYITVDPERDTPEVMREYLQPYPAFLGLTGDVAQIDQARAAFRVFAKRLSEPEDPDGYRVAHSAIAYLLAPDVCCLAHFSDALAEDEVLVRMRALLPPRQSGNGSAGVTSHPAPQP